MSTDQPIISAAENPREITCRVIILGTLLTIILAAANAFLGLKVGQTVSASIPAAIISMSILRFFKNTNVIENTMVQTMASVGEALTAGVAFILPALIILHAWTNFYYWQTVLLSLLAGILGVLFTIPLRRALLEDKTLQYPEGLAISNVLRASVDEKTDVKSLTIGSLIGSIISLCQTGFQVISDSFQYWVQTSHTLFGIGLGLSPALIGAGYIAGSSVAFSIFIGLVIGWLGGVPILTLYYGMPDGNTAYEMAANIWHSHIRYMGIGSMLVGGLWTLIQLFKPIVKSLSASMQSLKSAKTMAMHSRTDRDIPINVVFWSLAALMIPIFLIIFLMFIPASSTITHSFRIILAAFTALYILVGGFVFCSISSYFAGLIGSTNNPVSGLLVSALLILCLSILGFFNLSQGIAGHELLGAILGIGSMVIIGGALAISNDTMQDLKVGQSVGATPWKQQAILMFGVVITSFVVPPILDLLYNAYGIGGVFPHPGMPKSQMLAAPQAGLMAAVAEGIYSHSLEWTMICAGVVIGIMCICLDEVAKKFGARVPVLAVGLGIYLPLESSIPVVLGGILAYCVNAKLNTIPNREPNEQRGLLLACGIVAGASIMGVVLAIPFAIKQSSNALSIMPVQFQSLAGILGVIVTAIMCGWMYHYITKKN
jgi:putative OPT family oligopeptide transporter